VKVINNADFVATRLGLSRSNCYGLGLENKFRRHPQSQDRTTTVKVKLTVCLWQQ